MSFEPDDHQLQKWNQIFLNREKNPPSYDDWLEKYRCYLEASRDIPIIDLGCGFGNDSLYLSERGYKVISCDYSSEALIRLKYFIKHPETRLFNMLDGLPFVSNSIQVLIADLSLHYFSWDDTIRVINEIARVLVKSGILICRVNSVNDTEPVKE